MSVSRKIARLSLVIVVLGGLNAVRANDNSVPWVNSVIRLEPRPDRQKPPVVTAVAIQPGGSLLAIAGDDHWVRLHDTNTGDVIRILKRHDDWVRSVVFSPDGRTLATAGNDRVVFLWTVDTGELVRKFTVHENAITSVSFSHSGKLMAAAGFGKVIHVYEVESGREIYELECSCRDMRAVAFSPDDRMVAAGGRDGTIRMWDVQSGRQIRDLKGHRGRVRSIVFCGGGDHLASCSEDRQVRISRIDGLSSFALPRRGAKVLTLAFYDDEKLATGGSDNRIRLWDLTSRQEVGSLQGHTGSVATLARHGDILVSGSYDTSVRIWHIEDRKEVEFAAPVGGIQENTGFRLND